MLDNEHMCILQEQRDGIYSRWEKWYLEVLLVLVGFNSDLLLTQQNGSKDPID